MDNYENKLEQLEYSSNIHTYIYNGRIIPSVTQLVDKVLGNNYKNIPERILKQASAKGTRMHECIEVLEEKGVLLDDEYGLEVVNYLRLMKEYELKALESEALVLYADNDLEYAGRFDMLALSRNGKLVLIDFKRTYKIDIKRVGLQLNLYAEAYKYTYGEDVDKLYCMHLREDKGEMIEIKRDKKIISKISSLLQ